MRKSDILSPEIMIDTDRYYENKTLFIYLFIPHWKYGYGIIEADV